MSFVKVARSGADYDLHLGKPINNSKVLLGNVVFTRKLKKNFELIFNPKIFVIYKGFVYLHMYS